jgi:hypothetical protein
MESIELGVDTLQVSGDPTKLFEALAKAQAEFLPVPRSDQGQVGDNRKFRYAGYATLVRCIRPALSKYGICLLQPLHTRGGKAVTTTILAGHGASITASFYFKAEYVKTNKAGTFDDPQEFGRNHTYYRRYQLQSMVGVEGDDDADNLPRPEPVQFADSTSEPKSEPKSETKAEPKTETKSSPLNGKPVEEDRRTFNQKIGSVASKLGWKLADIKAFYKEHVDEAGFEKSDDLTDRQKAALLSKMVDINGLTSY